MLRYLSLRMLYTLPAVWLVVSIVFLLIHFVPGDPILQMLGEGAPAADVENTRHLYGLDLPLGEQYLHYWKGVLRGDLGPSLRFNQSVSKMIAQRYPYTLELTLASLLVAIVLSLPAGVRSAQRRNQWDDRALSVVSLFGLSFPNFALGPVLILFFAAKLGWLPVSGSGTFAHLVLPAITMGGALAAILTRMVRTSMLEELGQDYIRTARAKGATIDVPELIRTLASPDGSLRDKAWHELYGNLWHQGTIYEATAYAIPFLIRLLEAPAVPDKQRILLYLAMLFIGRSFWDVHKSTSILRGEVSKPGFEEKLKAELECVA